MPAAVRARAAAPRRERRAASKTHDGHKCRTQNTHLHYVRNTITYWTDVRTGGQPTPRCGICLLGARQRFVISEPRVLLAALPADGQIGYHFHRPPAETAPNLPTPHQPRSGPAQPPATTSPPPPSLLPYVQPKYRTPKRHGRHGPASTITWLRVPPPPARVLQPPAARSATSISSAPSYFTDWTDGGVV